MKDWNHWIFSEIIKFRKNINLNFINKKIINPKFLFKREKFLKNSSNYLPSALSSLVSSKKIFVQNLCLPKKDSLLFNLIYRQFRYGKIINNNFNSSLNLSARESKIKLSKKADPFTVFVYSLIKYNLPKIYWEDFRKINEILEKANLPKKPNIIATSLDHNYNDIFKIYCGTKLLSGTKLFLFQHGGFNGISGLKPDEKYEVKISDKYFTWGWKNKNKKIFPLFQQTTVNKNIKKNNEPKGLLMPFNDFYLMPNIVNDGFPRYKTEINNYIDNIVLFLSKIDKNISKNSSFKYQNNRKCSYTYKSLKYKFPNLRFFDSPKNTVSVSQDYKLVVETINSSGFLECLNLNIPVILIYEKNFSSLRKSALKEFNMLKKVKIVHTSSIEAAKFVNKNFNNIEKWWNEKNLQKVRKVFCYKFARKTDSLLKDFNKIFN